MFTLPGYKIREKIHQSSKSHVFRAVRTRDDLAVILKTMQASHPTSEQLFAFKREYALTHRLAGEGVITVHGLEQLHSSLFLVLEEMNGVPLFGFRVQNNEDLRLFLELAIRICRTLARIHEQGVIHKDINPGNILWNRENGQFRLIDFSIASESGPTKVEAEDSGWLEGTPAYISPEQTGRLNCTVDQRSDIYSLGATFYELLSGQPPFSEPDRHGLVYAAIARDPEPLLKLNPIIPEMLARIVARMMAKDPDARYNGAYGLGMDLERLLSEWLDSARVAPFPLGQNDRNDQFRLPRKIYGREIELATLAACLHEVRHGGKGLLLVEGEKGMGKSALVNEACAQIARDGGVFATARFSRTGEKQPYATIRRAFGALCDYWFYKQGADMHAFRRQVAKAAGRDGALLAALVPGLESVFGEEISQVNLAEAEDRVKSTLRRFIRQFVREAKPLVLFLDDLQWADKASIDLVFSLLKDPGIDHFLFVGAFRPGDLFPHELADLADQDIWLKRIRPRLLRREDLSHFLTDAVKGDEEELESATQMIIARTRGNPLYIIEMLEQLNRDRLLFFDGESNRWVWRLDELSRLDAWKSVVDFLMTGLHELTRKTREVLQLAACLGEEIDVKLLTLVAGKNLKELGQDLGPALDAKILVKLNEQHRYGRQKRTNACLRFQHKRLREAAYGSIEVGRHAALHLRIGRAFQAYSSEAHDGSGLALLDWIGHLNRGKDLVRSLRERRELASLNLEAGKMNLDRACYTQALPFFQIGLELLGKRLWRNHYDLAFPLKLSLAETHSHLGFVKRARADYRTLSRYARSDLEKARVMADQKIGLSEGRIQTAFDTTLNGLGLLAIHLPISPSSAHVKRESAAIHDVLIQRGFPDRIIFNETTEPYAEAAQALLVRLARLSRNMGNHNLFVLATVQALQLALEQGLTRETAKAFVYFGLIRALGKDPSNAEAYGNYALELVTKERYLAVRGRVFSLVAYMLQPFLVHFKMISNLLEKAVAACFKTHDVFFANIATGLIAHWDTNTNLAQKIEREKKAMALFQVSFPNHRFEMVFFHHFHLCLCDATNHHLSLDHGDFTEKQILSKGILAYQATLLTLKIQLFFIHEELKQAITVLKKMEPLVHSLAAIPLVQIKYCFYGFLVCAAVIKDAEKKDELRRRLHAFLDEMRRWAVECPLNFEHRLLFMEAEMAAIDGLQMEAMKRYEQAIKLAREREYAYHVPLIQDCAARFYLRSKGRIIANTLLREAEYGYARWGATARCRTIRMAFPQVFQVLQAVEVDDPKPQTVGSRVATDHDSCLDLTSAIKAAQIITSERKLDKLLEKIMQIVLKNAGAQRGCLVMPTPNGPRVEALASNGEVLFESVPLDGDTAHELVPITAITRVAQSRASLIANDPAREGELARDPYIQTIRPRSILCLALAKQKKLFGILYLEHRQTTGVFSAEHVNLLELLTTAAAISIENTRYFSRLEDKVTKRSRDLDARTRELESLDDIVRSINREREPRKVYDQVLYQGLRLFPEAGGAALFLNDGTGFFRSVAADDHLSAMVMNLALPVEATLRIILKKSEAWGRSIYRLPSAELFPDSKEAFLGNCLLLMLKQAKAQVGFIVWKGELFTPAQLPTLERFANHAASAVARARYLEEMAQKSEEIKSKTHALVATRDQLTMREKMAQLGVLTASISREITKPNKYIQAVAGAFQQSQVHFHGYLKRLAVGEDAVLEDFKAQFAKVEEQIKQVQVGVERIDHIVDTLAFVANLDEAHYELLDLAPLIQSAIDRVAPKFEDVKVGYVHCPSLWVHANAVLLSQVCQNIILNACQAIHRRLSAGMDLSCGSVQICLELQDDEAVVRFRDNGCGISPECMPQLFEAFFTTQPVGSGMGLGLYCVWSIMERHGGTVGVESEEAGGAVFTLHLPIKGGSS